MKLPIVHIEWDDAHEITDEAWVSRERMIAEAPNFGHCHTVGLLIAANPSYYLVAQSWEAGSDNVDHALKVPLVMVVNFVVIGEIEA